MSNKNSFQLVPAARYMYISYNGYFFRTIHLLVSKYIPSLMTSQSKVSNKQPSRSTPKMSDVKRVRTYQRKWICCQISQRAIDRYLNCSAGSREEFQSTSSIRGEWGLSITSQQVPESIWYSSLKSYLWDHFYKKLTNWQ